MAQSPVVPTPQMQRYTHNQQPPFGDPNNIIQKGNLLMSETLSFIQQIGLIAANLRAPTINPTFPTIPTAPLPVNVQMPPIKTVAWTVPDQPPANYGDLGNLDGYLPGPFTDLPPNLVFTTVPSPDYGSAPDSPSVDLNLDFPDKPDIHLPSAPQLLSIRDIQFDGVELPVFDTTEPVLDIMVPSVVGYEEGPLYTSTLLDMLKDDLEAAIANGVNIGLPTEALQGLFDASKENEYRAQQMAIDQLDDMEAMGFTMPPGVFLDARIKITTETTNKIAGLSRDIMVKQADLTLSNLVKAREDASALEGKLIDYTNQVAQRAFEAAKYKTEAMITIYNGQVEAYKSRIAAYTARAQVYDYQIRGALAIAEIYKYEVEAESAKAQVNVALVNAYKAEIDAAMANVEIYKAELSAVQIAAELQKTKVEVFAEQIRAYTGRINAFTAEVEAYKAGVQAQAIGMDAYKAKVDAYKATVEAGVAQIDGKVKGYQAKIAGYSASLNGFRAQLTSMTEQAKATAEYNTSQAEVFRAQVQAIASYNDVVTKQWQAAIEIAEKQAEVAIKAAEANAQLYVQSKQIAVEAAKAGAQVAAQLGAAAFNAISFSNSASWSSSGSQSYAESVSDASSRSAASTDSYSESKSV